MLYRRVDDDYLDPLTFKPGFACSACPAIMDVYRAGGITIANAPGTGIADDKAIYCYMPDIVEFYTGEKPILKNVPNLALFRTRFALPMCSIIWPNWWSRKCMDRADTAC